MGYLLNPPRCETANVSPAAIAGTVASPFSPPLFLVFLARLVTPRRPKIGELDEQNRIVVVSEPNIALVFRHRIHVYNSQHGEFVAHVPMWEGVAEHSENLVRIDHQYRTVQTEPAESLPIMNESAIRLPCRVATI